MTLYLKFIRDSAKARQFERTDGTRVWIPKSVVGSEVLDLPGPPARASAGKWIRVFISDWFCRKNSATFLREPQDVLCECKQINTVDSVSLLTKWAEEKRPVCPNCSRFIVQPKIRV